MNFSSADVPTIPVVPSTGISSNLNPTVTEFTPRSSSVIPPGVQTSSTWVYTNVMSTGTTSGPINQTSHVSQSNPSFQFIPNLNQGQNGNYQQVFELTKLLSDHVNLSRLPVPEPTIFLGDPLKYPDWKVTFEMLIDQKGIPQTERIHYLKKYIGGVAKEAVEGYFLVTSPRAYDEARQLLEDRYGSSYVIANAFRDRLENWPKIPNRDGAALRKFSDFLRQCGIAMETVSSLKVLDDDRENRKLLTKLPDWMIPQWGKIVSDTKERFGTFPTFRDFQRFVVKQADISCHPVTSFQALKQNSAPDTTRFVRSTKPKQVSSSSFSTSVDVPEYRGECTLCKQKHNVDSCFQLFSKSMEQRRAFVQENSLCFGCLQPGHTSKLCKNRAHCKICNKLHATMFHGDVRKSDNNSVRTNPRAKTTSNLCQENDTPIVESLSVNTRITNIARSSRPALSSMVVPVWVSHESNPQRETLVYALLDTQSDTSFILDSTCHALAVEGVRSELLLSTMSAKNQVIETSRIDGLRVRGHDSQDLISLETVYSRNLIPANRSHIPTPEVANRWPHLQSIKHNLMDLSTCEVGLLIGYDCASALAPIEVILPPGEGPYAQRTTLGWSIVGVVDDVCECESVECDEIGVSHRILTYPIPDNLSNPLTNTKSEVHFSCKTSVKEVVTPKDFLNMMEMDFNERASGKSYSHEDQRFLDILTKGVHQRTDKQYEMPLPFKTNQASLPNNKSLAISRLQPLKRRLQADAKYRADYVKFMENVIDKGYAEKVPTSELNQNDGRVYYIPHHGVYHQKKNKIRVVFDCSAKFKGESLNDHLLSGPSLTNTLLGVLCRFRHEPIAFMCDIEQMFYQFKVDENQRNFLRFLWWENGNYETDPTEFRMNVHIFGAASSPGCANFGLKQIASDNEAKYGSDVVQFIHRNFYVDDGLKAVPTPELAIDLIKRAQAVCSEGKVHLHKFVSNSTEVVKSLPTSELSSGMQDLNLLKTENPIERALGVQWCVDLDQFSFKIALKDQPMTRRGILSTINSVYDPLGFLAPVILEGKIILQEMCKDNLGWDDDLPDTLRSRWQLWRSCLSKLEFFHIPRCFKPANFGNVQTAELHHFSDASNFAYGQCSYLRLVNDQGEVHCTLVIGKSRVAPLKTMTIPRLELTAALVSVRISKFLQDELDYENIAETFWTDSKVVLGYISNESRRFHIFVANRVQQIRDHSSPSQWRYVKSNDNPADMSSRGVTAEEFSKSSTWINGPSFLWEKDISTYGKDITPDLNPHDPELKKVQVMVSQSETVTGFDLARLEVFSDWFRAKRAVATCLRLKSLLQGRLLKKQKSSIHSDLSEYKSVTVQELDQAEIEIIKQVQAKAFSEELKCLQMLQSGDDRHARRIRNNHLKKSSSLSRLDPFIDQNGILRVGGRLRRANLSDTLKHPVILPRKGHVTELIIDYFHKQTAHQGRNTTTNAIRSNGYWIVGCSAAVSNFIYKCVTCRKLRGRLQSQKMSDLPSDRVEPSPPFSFVGVDFFGPWIVKEGRKSLKRYGALFTCLSSRAIHIEVATDLSTDAFMNALRRFLSVRGPIRLLRSDCGTNFIGTLSEQKAALSELDQSHIKQFLLSKGCDYVEFKFNVPSASHMGGVWERQIRTVRNVLNALMQQVSGQLNDDSLRTVMCEAAAIVNSRPLTVENVNDPLSLNPLTPNHLLTMKSSVLLSPPGKFDESDLYARKRWRRVQHLVNEFWYRWRREYLQNLQTRQKWVQPKRNLKVNDVVIVKDENLPRGEWCLGRVIETFPSQDGYVRSVKLAIGNSNLDKNGKPMRAMSFIKRPIHKLVLIVESNEE